MHLPGGANKQGTRGNAARMHVPIGVASAEVWHTFFFGSIFFFGSRLAAFEGAWGGDVSGAGWLHA